MRPVVEVDNSDQKIFHHFFLLRGEMQCLRRRESTFHSLLHAIIRRQTPCLLKVRYNSTPSTDAKTSRARNDVQDQIPRFRNSPLGVWERHQKKQTGLKLLKQYEEKIQLTQTEAHIINYLNVTATYLNRERLLNGPTESPVQLYMVGGWVRDKLLDRPTENMDIIVRNIAPKEFVQRMIDLCGLVQNSPRLMPPTANTDKVDARLFKPRIRKDEQNGGYDPAARTIQCGTYTFEYQLRGRSISVAGCTIFNYFVNMEFTNPAFDLSNSRETTEEVLEFQMDAMQRELTVNAIYLDLNTMKLLDPTRKGLEDINSKVLRTPLSPIETLMNDPTRVLRIMRFSSIFQNDGFTLDKKTAEAFSDLSVHVFFPSLDLVNCSRRH